MDQKENVYVKYLLDFLRKSRYHSLALILTNREVNVNEQIIDL